MPLPGGASLTGATVVRWVSIRARIRRLRRIREVAELRHFVVFGFAHLLLQRLTNLGKGFLLLAEIPFLIGQ